MLQTPHHPQPAGSCAGAGIPFAAKVIYPLPGQFRTVAAAFRSSAEQFGRVSRQFRTLAGPMRTLPENSGRGRRHSVCVRRHSVRCRSYLPAARTIQDGGGGFRVVGGTIRESVERIRLPVAAVLPAGGTFSSRSGRTRTRPTKARFNAVACVCGQSECSPKWIAGEEEVVLLHSEADGRLLTAPVPAHPHEADHVVPEVSRSVHLAVPDPLHGIGTARLVLQGGGRGHYQ